jgi:hypothetical protein
MGAIALARQPTGRPECHQQLRRGPCNAIVSGDACLRYEKLSSKARLVEVAGESRNGNRRSLLGGYRVGDN